jgi:hypothetical protein
MKRRPARTSPNILRWTYALANGKQLQIYKLTNVIYAIVNYLVTIHQHLHIEYLS